MTQEQFDALCELINDVAYLEATRFGVARTSPGHMLRLEARVRRSRETLYRLMVKEKDDGDPSTS